jgi:twinkle protein
MLNKENLDLILGQYTENTRIVCPECSEERTKKNIRTMNLTVDGNSTLYHCHHCGIAGKVRHPDYREPVPKIRAISVPKTIDEGLIEQYLSGRGIDFKAVKDYPIVSGHKFYHGHGELPSVGFVYGDKEAVKWRSIEGKNFTQDGASRTLWGIESLPEGAKTLVIVEGEMDLLACASAGVDCCVSVPNGAPIKVSSKAIVQADDTKFNYVWAAKDVIESVDRVILAVDSDDAGTALAEELARRIGRAKCWTVKWPADCKDANDVLQKLGSEALSDAIGEAEAMPLEGVYSADDYALEISNLYDKGLVGGISTGLASVDKLFTIVPGQLSVVTGLPGSGKSEFIDQIMVNLAQSEGWKFAVASFENPPPLHIAKLSEKYVGKPFFEGSPDRMSRVESVNAMKWVSDHFLFLEQRGGDSATIESILDRARQAVMRLGIRGLVIDPYNYIAQSKSMDNEHQGINEMLTKLVSFARANQIHIWFIAHPAKMATNPDGTTAVPKGMNISGSAAFFAKADLGVTVHLSPEKDTEIHVWKCRFKWIGTTGGTVLGYDIPTGRYSEVKWDKLENPYETSKDWNETDSEWL